MKPGIIFPQREIGSDPERIRDYARKTESLGFDHLLTYEHVVGVKPGPGQGNAVYNYRDSFHEQLVLFGYLSGVTDRLELVTGILILPQRPTVLVAKQAAQVDILSRGRLRLGVSVGWYKPEYEVLGQRFDNRGKRIEEQIRVLRTLWENEVADFEGHWHEFKNVCLNTPPVQKPIPVWMGGMAEPVMQRAARMADGWIPNMHPNRAGQRQMRTMNRLLKKQDRDPEDFGVQGLLHLGESDPEEWLQRARAWRQLGATHLAVGPMDRGLDPAGHVDFLDRLKTRLRDAGLSFAEDGL